MRQKFSFRRSTAIAVSLMFLMVANQMTSAQTADNASESFEELARGAVKRMGGRFDKNRMLLERLYSSYTVVRELAPPSAEDIDSLEALERESYEAYVNNRRGEARQILHRAFARLTGKEWSERDEYIQSLALFTDMTVTDPDRTLIARLGQLYPSSYKPQSDLRLEAAILRMKPGSKPSPIGETTKFECLLPDLIDKHFSFALDIHNLQEGAYSLRVDVFEDNTPLRRLLTPLCLVRGLEESRLQAETRLEKISGHESTKATIRYPFEFASLVNLGRREARAFNFRAAINKSDKLVTALESGIEPLYGAVGDNPRHYRLVEANEIIPYRLYVPTQYNSQRSWPLIVVLHGGGGTENTMPAHHKGGLRKLAEKHGYIVASPLGYRPWGGYGRKLGALRNPVLARIVERSEKDVMNVLELVRKEYNVDAERIFLMGFSMGGSGTWHLGAKYSDVWAAIAPIGAGKPALGSAKDRPLIAGATPTATEPYNFEALRNTPVFVSHGELDPRAPVANARAMVARMKELGLTHEYFEKEGAGHGGIIIPAFPRIVDFFNRVESKDSVHK